MFQMGGHKPAPPQPARAAKQARKPPRVPRRTAVTVHLDAAERERFEALGGEDWLREQLRVPGAG